MMCQDGAEKLVVVTKDIFGWKATVAIWIYLVVNHEAVAQKRSPGTCTCSKFRIIRNATPAGRFAEVDRKKEVVCLFRCPATTSLLNPIDFTCWKECCEAPHCHRTRGTCATWMRRKTVVENAAVRGISWGNSAVNIAQHFWNLGCSCGKTNCAPGIVHFSNYHKTATCFSHTHTHIYIFIYFQCTNPR